MRRYQMPLSEYEQRVLEQMERQLSSDDPKLVHALQGAPTGMRRWLLTGAPATRPTARCTVSTSASASCATVVMPQRASASPVRSPTPHSELTGRACRKGTVASRGTSRTPSGLAMPEASFATNLVAAIPTEQVTP